MWYPVVAAGLLLHTCWWGTGLALALTPRRWRHFWPLFVPVCGFSLQSAVVWIGVLCDLPGTETYGGYVQLLPLGLLWWQGQRHGWRRVWGDWRRTALVWLLVCVVAGLLIRPMSHASSTLTTVSLGSCDAADYAAGARLMQEFRRSDRDGFLGLTEVVQLHSVDNFFDHFVYLNHFTPSALVALSGSLFRLQPYELVGVMTAVFLAASLPIVFWLARATLRLSPGGALFVTAIYGLSPVTWYAVFHVAMSQLLAAQAIALLTIGGVDLWRRRVTRRSVAEWAGLLAVGYGLVFGAYHFIILVALVPAMSVAGLSAAWRRDWATLARWDFAMMLPGAAAAAFYGLRIAGLVERFQLFQANDFGWIIRGLSPEGWLGVVEGPTFAPLPSVWRWLVVAVVGLAMIRVAMSQRWRRKQGLLAFAFTVPVLIGYLYLLVRGHVAGTNASYDAYKLLSVFYPAILGVVCSWTMLWNVSRWERGLTLGLGALVLAGNVTSVRTFSRQVANAPLTVDPALATLREIENRPDVDSINLSLDDMWSRLWANGFLLRRPHYFPIHTYEGRRNTELRGNWDLTAGIARVRDAGAVAAAEAKALPAPYALRPRLNPDDVRIALGAGWYDLEQLPRTRERWRWATADAELTVETRGPLARHATIELDVRSVQPRELEVWRGAARLGSVLVGVNRTVARFPQLLLEPGTTTLRLRSQTPAVAPGGADSRPLLVCVYRFDLVLHPAELPLPPSGAARQNRLP